MPLLKLQKASKAELGKVGPKKGKGDGFVDDPLVRGDKSFKSRNMAEPMRSKTSEKEVVKQTKENPMSVKKAAHHMKKAAEHHAMAKQYMESAGDSRKQSGISKKEAKTERGTRAEKAGR